MKIANADQMSANPARRSGGIGSPNTNTPRMNCTDGVGYCNNPRYVSGIRVAAPAKNRSRTAVAGPAAIRSSVVVPERSPAHEL